MNALQTPEPRYRSLFEGNPAAVLLLDPKGRIVEANAATRRLFGYEPGGLCGQRLSVVMPDWDMPEMLADLARHPEPHDAIWRHARGRRCDAVVTLLPAAAEGDMAEPGYFLVARDVTAQRRRQRQMQVQAEILARTQDAVVVLDEAGEVVCWNVGATRLYGRGAQAMIGQAYAGLFGAPDRARLEQALAEARCGAPEATPLRVHRVGPQRHEVELLLSVSRIAGVDPGSELWVLQGQEVTARVQGDRAAHAAPCGAEVPL